MKIFGRELSNPFKRGPEVIAVDDMDPWAYQGQQILSNWENSIFDGGKFAGGFGPTQVQFTDYWTLRARSAQLFNENLYAKGIIRRLVTNEVNTGLIPEATPVAGILGMDEDTLAEWSETVESRFSIWAKNPELCDWKRANTFAHIQRTARMAALIEGDVLIVMRQSQRTLLPNIQLISGNMVQTPLAADINRIRKGHRIVEGVEHDALGRVVAFWIRQNDGFSFKRQAAFGEKSGRRQAWLYYGSDKRNEEVRGQPILSVVLQSLKEIDRYRDSTQRKAVVNSMLAMFIKKTEDKIGSLPATAGAVRKDTATSTDSDGNRTTKSVLQQIPGIVMETLQTGEEPVALGGQGTDENFSTFEAAIIQGVGWALEMPPEILTLSFSNNYSASQAALNEFKIYLNRFWGSFGDELCQPIYQDWLLSEILTGKVLAPGLLEAWRDIRKYDVFGAWVSAEWYGSIKPTTDILKQAKGSELLVLNAWSTNARESRGITGTKWSQNIKRVTRENQQLADARRPLLEVEAEFGVDKDDSIVRALSDQIIELQDQIEELK